MINTGATSDTRYYFTTLTESRSSKTSHAMNLGVMGQAMDGWYELLRYYLPCRADRKPYLGDPIKHLRFLARVM